MSNEVILRRYSPEATGRKIETAYTHGAVRRYRPASVKARGFPRWAIPAVVCLVALLIVPIRLFGSSAQIEDSV